MWADWESPSLQRGEDVKKLETATKAIPPTI